MLDEKAGLPYVTIVGRNDGRGQGVRWDALTTYALVPTKIGIAHNEAMKTEAVTGKYLSEDTPFKEKAKFLKMGDFGQGLLIIPGRARRIREAHQAAFEARLQFEQEIIKDALLRKRPILAICGGSWSLWQALGGGYKLQRINGHDIASVRPSDDIYLEEDGRVHSNVQVHKIHFTGESLLKKAMSGDEDTVPDAIEVNSIHGFVVDEKTKPDGVRITARASEALLPDCQSDVGTVEAFETTDGHAIGIQCHPEAYTTGDTSYKYMQRLFAYMVDKGKDYDKTPLSKVSKECLPQATLKTTVNVELTQFFKQRSICADKDNSEWSMPLLSTTLS